MQLIFGGYIKSYSLSSIILLSFSFLYILFVYGSSTILPAYGSELLYPKPGSIQEQNSLIPLPYYLSLQHPQVRQEIQKVSSNDNITNDGNINNNTNATSASSPALGIQMGYPSEWIVNDLGNGTIRFSSPLRTDLMRLTVNVVNLPDSLKNITLDEIVQQNINRSKVQFSNFSLIESNATTVSPENQSAHKIVYTNTNKDPNFPIKFKTMQIFAIKDGQLVTISYISEDSQYFRYLPTIESMIDSITFTRESNLQTAGSISNSLISILGRI